MNLNFIVSFECDIATQVIWYSIVELLALKPAFAEQPALVTVRPVTNNGDHGATLF